MAQLKIKQVRLAQGKTQETLAALSGVSTDRISRMENNALQCVDLDAVALIANALNVSPHDLIDFESVHENQ